MTSADGLPQEDPQSSPDGPNVCLPAVHCKNCTCIPAPPLPPPPKSFPHSYLPDNVTDVAKSCAYITVAVGAVCFHESFVWTVLLAVMTEMKVFRLIDRYLSIDDDASPLTVLVQSLFILLYTVLIIALFVFVFYTASQEGYDSFHKGVHNWLNRKTTCSQFYGYTGTVDTFNMVIDAFPTAPSPGFWKRAINLQTRRLTFCKRLNEQLGFAHGFDTTNGQSCKICSDYTRPFGIARCLAPRVFQR